jgi:hypothetical protein
MIERMQHLGNFDDEHEAARAVDTAARRLRGEDAHGTWMRLNFPASGRGEPRRSACQQHTRRPKLSSGSERAV